MSDGGLRQLFSSNLPDAMWQGVESWSTGQGVPDAHFCFPGGISGWIENKRTQAWSVDMRKEQVAWLERYVRKGGRCFIVVRRQTSAGPRKGKAVDELWLFHGAAARGLLLTGLEGEGRSRLGCWPGGPANWDWGQVRALLVG